MWIYVRDAGDAFGGLVVMSLDHDEDEATFVSIDGLIDPAEVGRLTHFGSFGLGDDHRGNAESSDEGDGN